MDLQQIANNAKINELHKSIEFRVYQYMDKIQDAYMRLTNAKVFKLNLAETEDALKEIRSLSKELYLYLVTELNARGVTTEENKNVNARVVPTLDLALQNMVQYGHRFCFSNVPGDKIIDQDGVEQIVQQDFKIMNLTCFANIVPILIATSEEAKAESYFREIAGF